MPTKLAIYLDTSVISACLDARDPVRQELTQHFWQQLPAFAAHICPVVLDEIGNTSDPARRSEMFAFAQPLIVLPWQPEMERLARCYVAGGAFTAALLQDARHVAACTVAGISVLLSWNFRHLVNRTRRIRVNLVNSSEGYGQVEILAPPELN